MSEAEMDAHTIRNMREQSAADGQPPKDLVCLKPADPLKAVIRQLFKNRCSMAPVLTWDAHGTPPPPPPSLVHTPPPSVAFLHRQLSCMFHLCSYGFVLCTNSLYRAFLHLRPPGPALY